MLVKASREDTYIPAPSGSSVYDCYEGKVVSYAWQHKGKRDHAYGMHIRLRHQIEGEVYTTVYAHLSRDNVSAEILSSKVISLAWQVTQETPGAVTCI